jgi:hypothetical protein
LARTAASRGVTADAAVALRRAGRSPAETAELLGVTERSVRRMCHGADLFRAAPDVAATEAHTAPVSATELEPRRVTRPVEPRAHEGTGRAVGGGATIDREALLRLNGLADYGPDYAAWIRSHMPEFVRCISCGATTLFTGWERRHDCQAQEWVR